MDSVEARVRANTEHIARGAGDYKGGRGKHKPVGNRDMKRSVEGRRMERGAWVSKMDTTGTFMKESMEFE